MFFLSISWDDIGGLSSHVHKIKEMVLLPLMYPEEFAKFKIQPPKGVIFHGPPGTGKTLMARILAAEASKHGKKVNINYAPFLKRMSTPYGNLFLPPLNKTSFINSHEDVLIFQNLIGK